MTGGYTGKILRVDLSTQTISTIDTSKYEQWGGGHGIGSAIFWDLCKDKTVGGTDPGNVLTIMTSPLAGTAAPCVGRAEMQGIGLQAYPTDWFNRSNFGGRFPGQLKAAGWDGVVIEGKASSLCWLNIVNDKVTIEDASSLKGMDCWETQVEIWSRASGNTKSGEWLAVDGGYSTQNSAVLCISAAGENLSRIACVLHDSGDAAGQGFGGVFGSKNLKAIAVQGTGGVQVANPTALMNGRIWLRAKIKPIMLRQDGMDSLPGDNPMFRMSGCQSCALPERGVFRNGIFNQSQCQEENWYQGNVRTVNPDFSDVEARRATDLVQRYGINSFDAANVHIYLRTLYERGMVGPGKAIDPAPLNMETYGTLGFAEEMLKAIAFRKGIGDLLANGIIRAAEKWGTLQADLDNGVLKYPIWGYPAHSNLPAVEWSYGSLFGERDVNEHTFSDMYGSIGAVEGLADRLPADKFVELMASRLVPFTGDPLMLDYSDGPTGIYSDHKAKLIAWTRYYGRFWKQSALFCDQPNLFPSFIEGETNTSGITPEGEPMFWNAITGQNMSFADSMVVGRKIWNLDRAIWVLQGRHRDQEKFTGCMLKPGMAGGTALPSYADGKWSYQKMKDRFLKADSVEQFKTTYYGVEGWDPKSGWPTRATLEKLGMKNVADELAAKGKLGS
jgi:aldehyde:ferredoxin oxidoreductase